MVSNNETPHDTGSIISLLVGKKHTDLNHPSILYAEEKKIFPLLHLAPIIEGKQFNLLKKQYHMTKNQNTVEFVMNYLDNCWINGKIEQNHIGFYQILDGYNRKLGIKDRGQEIKENSRIDLYYIIRYLKLSEVYNDQFYDEIWKDAPAEVKTAKYLEEHKNISVS